MTFTLKTEKRCGHYISLEINTNGIYIVEDNELYESGICRNVSNYRTIDKKNAMATYNRYLRKYKGV